MISKVTESNKALYEARLAQINAALEAKGSSTRITDFESYFGNIREIEALATNFKGSASGDSEEGTPGKFLLMPLDEPLFEIDANKRTISVPTDFNKNGIGVRGDHMAETLYFKIDRYFDHQDLFGVDEIIINWQFRPSNASRNAEIPMHTSLAFAPDEEYIPNCVVFGWVIGDYQDENGEWVKMTPSKGTLNFSVGFVKKEDNRYQYALNTMVASVNVNDSLYLENPSILSLLKRPVFERLTDSRYSEAGVEPVNDPIWRSGQEDKNEFNETIFKGLYPIANFNLPDEGEEEDELLLSAIGYVGDQAGINIKYDWTGTSFATGQSVAGRDRNSASVETDWVPTKDLTPQDGVTYYIKNGAEMVALDASNLESSFADNSIIKYELGSSFVVTEGGTYRVDMQAFKTTTQSEGASVVSKSRSIGSIECVVPHAAIPAVTLKVAGVTPEDGDYVIANEEIANQYTFIDETRSPSVKAIVTKDERNVMSRTSLNNVEVSINKLTEAPNDINKVNSQANQDNIEIVQNGSNAIVIGHIDALNRFESTNPNQGEAKWIGIDIGVNVNDITELTWNGSALTADDVAEAASLGLGDGHIIFWAKAEQLPRVIRIGREGYGEAEIKVSFVETEDYVPAADNTVDVEKALANARKGIIKESSLGKIGFIMVDGNEEPDFSNISSNDLVRYDSASEFIISSTEDDVPIEGSYCVYAVNERNHTRSISEPSNVINVSKIAPKLSYINVTVKNPSGFDFVLIENNETKMRENEQTGEFVPTVYDMPADGAHCRIVIGDNFDDFKDTVEVQLTVREIDREAWEAGNLVFITTDDEVPYEYSVDDNNEFVIGAIDSGLFVIEAITKYNGVERTTYTEPLHLSHI